MGERVVQPVIRGERRHVLAHHDRAGSASESIGMADHPAQLCQVDAGGLGQLHRLTRGGIADERQHVARQLHSRPRTRLAGMDDHRCELLERGLDPLVHLAVGAHHHGQLTLVGRPAAAADRRIDDVNALGLQISRELDCSLGADRGVDGDDCPRLRMRGELSDDLPHLLVVEHGDADDVSGRHVRDAVSQRRTELGQRRHGLGTHVEYRDTARPFHEPLGHGRTHVSETDIAEFRFVALTHEFAALSADDLSAVDVEDLAGDPLGLIR